MSDSTKYLELANGAFLEAIARRYRGPLNRFFRNRMRAGEQDCEDLTQEVMLRLVRRRKNDAIERIDGYVFRTAAAVLVDQNRRRMARGAGLGESYDESRHAPADFSPERVLAGKARLQRALAAIEALPSRARQAFILFRFEDKRQAEIAQIMGISVSAVEKHIKFAIQRLHEAMQEEL